LGTQRMPGMTVIKQTNLLASAIKTMGPKKAKADEQKESEMDF